ncbi:MAG: NFACT family protein, partial [Clostridiales bacterium]|nr:NFACT family protein [Clostridiales bacterium]
ITLGLVKKELEDVILNAKVDKIHQPGKNELTFIMRTRTGSYRLFMSSNNQCPRIHLSRYTVENPPVPPMLCMLLRKRLTGAVLSEIRQVGNDRILELVFDGSNDIGDKTRYYIVIELLSQKSNIIFLDEERKVIDAVKRVTDDFKDIREIYPGISYDYPERQDKLDRIIGDTSEIAKRICSYGGIMLARAWLDAIEGISPIVGRELAYRAVFGDKKVSDLSDIEKDRINDEIVKLKDDIAYSKAYGLSSGDRINFDFTFTRVRQYGDAAEIKEYDSFCDILDEFYFEKDRYLRTRQKASDLFKRLNSSIERTARKINVRKAELEKSQNREDIRLYAELITANQYKLSDKASFYELENYYDNKLVRIPADPSLTPQQNAQKYFREYKKAINAEKMLHDLISEGEEELSYLDSVTDSLSRAVTEAEIGEIRAELEDGGYIHKRQQKGKVQKTKSPEPLEFESSDGFRILVGRNNTQNDYLTFKIAKNYDLWLHVQKQAGSHTIICSDNREISENAIKEAASIAAYYSKSSQSSSVAVDYTLVKNIKKPNGAKPGKVIYYTYNTLYVTPDKEIAEKLKKTAL